MKHKLNLLLLFGGRSGEHAVSLMSAASIKEAIDKEKYVVHQVGITQDGAWLTGQSTLETFKDGSIAGLSEVVLINEQGKVNLYTRSNNQLRLLTSVDVIFPVLHGTYGEDGTIQGMFEILDAAYVGAGVLGSSTAMDKSICKHIIEAEGIGARIRDFSRNDVNNQLEKVFEDAEKLPHTHCSSSRPTLDHLSASAKPHNRAELIPPSKSGQI